MYINRRDQEISACFKKALHRPASTRELKDHGEKFTSTEVDAQFLIEHLKSGPEYSAVLSSIENARRAPEKTSKQVEWLKDTLRIVWRLPQNYITARKLGQLADKFDRDFIHSDESRAYEKSVAKLRDKVMSAVSLEAMLRIHQTHAFEDWKQMTTHVYNMLKIRPGDFDFDAGFGSGAPMSLFLYKTRMRSKGLSVAGCDFCKLYVEHARQTIPLRGHTWLHMFQENISALPDNMFDSTMSIGTMVYQTDSKVHEDIVGNLIRITRPGGRVFVGTLQEPDDLPDKTTPGQGSLDKAILPEIAKEHGAQIIAIGSDREMVGALTERHHPDKRYSVLFEKNG